MSDLIDRQAALDALIFDVRADRQNGKTLMVRYAEEVLKRIKALPSAQPWEDIRAICGECDAWNQYKNYPWPGWIPCSERCPEHRVYVLVAYNPVYGIPDIGITWYSKSEGKWNTSREVLAWMPLPKPYEGERDDNT